MKKVSLALNAVLIVAVAVLYFLHFSGSQKKEESKQIIVTEDNGTPAEIVYVNFDTLVNNLDQYIDETAALEAKYGRKKKDLEERAQKFQKSVLDLQNRAQKGLITSSNFREEEERLQQEQMYLGQQEQKFTYELNEENTVLTRGIMFNIMQYVNKYNADKKYKFVLNNSFGGTLLYGNEGLNITKDIIDGMNADYAKETKGK